MTKEKLIKLGSRRAKKGFKNEKDIVKKFNHWQNDEDAQEWLRIMGYDLEKIESDAGKETSKMLQFKINPVELFNN